jgi:hypothetical protein
MRTHSIKYITFSIGFLAIGLSIAATVKKTSGGHAGSTGAPNELTCAQSGCHSDASVNDGAGINTITFGNSETHYEPGNTYQIKVNVKKTGIKKFGFEIVALRDKVNSNAGQFVITNSTRTHTTVDGVRTYVTHTANGTIPTATGENEWTFNWKAPTTDLGRVTFYLATNCTNADNTNQDDEIFLSKLTIHSPSTVGIEEPGISAAKINVYPNPSSDFISIDYLQAESCFTTVSIVNTEGKVVKTIYKGMEHAGEKNLRCSVDDLPPGYYFVTICSKGANATQSIKVL